MQLIKSRIFLVLLVSLLTACASNNNTLTPGPVNFVPVNYPLNCCPKKLVEHGTCEQEMIARKLNGQGVQVEKRGDILRMILFSDCCFVPGTADIKEGCFPLLNTMTTLIKTYNQNVPIRVAGFTDEVEDNCNAYQLTKERAVSIIGYFWTHGIALQRMTPIGYGCNYPIASPHTVCGNAFNRRTEISLCGVCW